MKMKIFSAVAISAFFISCSGSAFAHPGRTASDGCHYCRTNCDSWGEVWNERHCHGGSESSPIQPKVERVIPQPTRKPTRLPTIKPSTTNIPSPTTIVSTQKPIPTFNKLEETNSNKKNTTTAEAATGLGILGGMGYGGFWMIRKVLSKFIK